MTQPTCIDRWNDQKDAHIDSLREDWNAYCSNGDDESTEAFHNHGLCFDYVSDDTFDDQEGGGYWRYQISWGGPSSEYRLYADNCEDQHPSVEFWFLDWFDGHGGTLSGDDLNLLHEVWGWFQEGGSVKAEYEKNPGE